MSGTRVIWILAAVLVCAALGLVLMPDGEPPMRVAEEPRAQEAPVQPTPAPTVPAQTTPAPAPPATPTTRATPAKTLEEFARPAPLLPTVRDPDAVSLGLREPIPNATVVPGNIVPRTDPATGEKYLLADGEYTIRGEGTQEHPYRVSWECLKSASKTYIPRLKEYELPQRVALLSGKWLRIEGYLLFPLFPRETEQLTIAFNQYDGCCIGVPPSAYDGIEVILRAPEKRAGGHGTFAFGSVEGKFTVDPILREGWLIGLYLMEDAALNQNLQPEL